MGASESKLAFKEDIFRLAGEQDIPADEPWWTRVRIPLSTLQYKSNTDKFQFYQLPESAEDVYALWSPNDLHALLGTAEYPRNIQSQPPRNVNTLIYVVIARLEELQVKVLTKEPQANITPEALNCLRILTRLLPYIYECEQLSTWEDQFFWQNQKPTWIWDKKYNRHGPLFDGLKPSKSFENTDVDKEIGVPLGERLLDILLRYLFLPGFALPKKPDAQVQPDLKISYPIWQSGIGCKQSNGMTKDNEKNAMEVLRLMLVMTSRMLYTSSGVVAQTDIKALTYLTTESSRQVVLSLICSLMNTVLKYNPASWRVPLELSTVGKDPKQQLVTYSLQLLLILVIYPTQQESQEANAFRKALSRLHRAEDFQFIQQGLTTVLTQPLSGMASYVPSVSKAAPFTSEMLIFFWELLQCNKRFRSFIVDTDRAHDFMILILYYAIEAKDDPARQGTVRMCVFVLQTLSVEASFGERLNKHFKGHESLPAVLRVPNFHGSYADYLITSIHTILTTTQGRLESIYPALLAIMNNIAPFVQGMERATSSKLIELFTVFAAPQFLLANETNHVMLQALLEIMNTILEHQYAENRRFIEVLVRSHRRFEALRNFTVDGALAELDRIAQDRKARAENYNARASRSPSMDSVRSPIHARSPTLDNVPEYGAFAVGDDDDDVSLSRTSTSTPITESSAMSGSIDDAVPVQSRSMSEKARGKQPVGQGSFSRSTSRNVSTTSLTGILNSSGGAHFIATPEWLETWLPHLALHDILLVISTERDRFKHQLLEEQRLQGPGSSIRRSSIITGPLVSPLQPPGPIKLQAFTWSSLALGWYLSMLWGFIYAQDASANRGSNGLWTGTSIRLFNIQSRTENITLRSPKGAVDAVGDSLARRISGFSFSAAASPTTSQPSMREV